MQRLSGGGERYYLDPSSGSSCCSPSLTSADLDYAKQIVGRVERFLGGQTCRPIPA